MALSPRSAPDGPFGALLVVHGAHNWCSSELMAAGGGNYQNKRVSIRVLPPGVRCQGDLGDDGPFEAMWPINW